MTENIKFGLYMPNFGESLGNARIMAELAADAEKAGWDGFFIWDHIIIDSDSPLPMVDPWVALTAVAMNTKKIRFGTTITPLPRRRPWKLARETVTLDQLSGGRLILGIGLGASHDFAAFGEETDPKTRAGKLDEGLEILTGLWKEKVFDYDGQYYKLNQVKFLPKPVQSPRIPIWVAGTWPNKAPFQRAARWDGIIPLKAGFEEVFLTPDDFKNILEYIKKFNPNLRAFDVVCIGVTLEEDPEKDLEKIKSYINAGGNWWLEYIDEWRGSLKEIREIIRNGPKKP